MTILYSVLAKLGRAIELAELRVMMRHGLLPYQPDPFGFVQAGRVDRDAEATARRWDLIAPHLPRTAYSALDVGCNIGFFSFRMAQHGADHVIGVDVERGPLLIAEKLKSLSRVGNAGFLTLRVNETNVDLLGDYDVVLFLSVFHHLVYQHGIDSARRVLSRLIMKTRKILFFESGQGDQTFGEMAGAMPRIKPGEGESYFSDLLRECGASAVVAIGETLVKNDARRVLFRVSPPDGSP